MLFILSAQALGQRWRAASAGERRPFEAKAEAASARYQADLAAYVPPPAARAGGASSQRYDPHSNGFAPVGAGGAAAAAMDPHSFSEEARKPLLCFLK